VKMMAAHAGLGAVAAVRGGPGLRRGGSRWTRRRAALLACASIAVVTCLAVAVPVAGAIHHLYFDRTNLPDLGSLTRFEFSTIGHVYDTNGQPLIELARENRQISSYEDIPPIVRDAILAAEDKRFFSHNGVSYASLPRVLVKVRVGTLVARLVSGLGREVNSAAIFPQGGSTITQQLVRGSFIRDHAALENGDRISHAGLVARALSSVIGARSVKMLARKRDDFTLVVGRTADVRAVWVKTPSEGRDSRPIREPRVHGERSVWICDGSAVLLRPIPVHVHDRRCRQGSPSRGDPQVCSVLRADSQ
jgi:Transglycosylase